MKVKVLLVVLIVFYKINLNAAEAGMPQLDPTYWFSQAFWLILIFSLLYISIAKFFIPKIKDNLEDRENKIKDDLTTQIEQKNLEIENFEINEKLKNEKVDITLPIRPGRQGKIHPVSQVIDEISSIFSEIGFSVAEGPDVETEYNNFTALNTPEEHPARDMHDTFYLGENKKLLLRTHTSFHLSFGCIKELKMD